MRVLLICSGGWSTGLLVTDMKKYAKQDDVIEATGFDSLEDVINDYDIILLGPQISFKFQTIEKFCTSLGKKAAKIDPTNYGRVNGEVVYKQAEDLFNAS